MKLSVSNRCFFVLLLLCIFTTIIYAETLKYPLLSNDDLDFFTKYPEILNLSWKSIGQYFSNYYVTLYQPLTVLSFALNYHFAGTSPIQLHLVNLSFHLINIILLFVLFNKFFKNPNPVLLIAFLFAVHPMNVEAVTWISARSSSMYTCFYLLSLIFYIKYFTSKLQIKFLFISFLFFILSLFCKVQAVTLPLVLMLFDYFLNRKKINLLIFEKLPFVILSVVFTLIAFKNSETFTYFTYSKLHSYTSFDHIFLIGRAIFFYLQKFLVPVNLSAIYVFPVKSNNWLPYEYYIYSSLVVILSFIIWRCRKNKKLIFGAGIFLLTLSINLPLVSLRSIIFADRYAYLPYLGLFFLLATFYQSFTEKNLNTNRKYIYILTILILLYGFFLSFETWDVNKKWENDMTLTSDIIQKNPPVPLIAKIYRKRGNYFADHQMFQESINDYSKAIEINPDDIDSYIHRAFSYLKLNKLSEALPDLDKGIEKKPNSSILYANRAMVKMNLGDKIGSFADCTKCLSLDSMNAEVYNCLAILKFQSGDLPGALLELRSAIRVNDHYAEAYKNLGIILLQMDNVSQACYYWRIAAQLGDRQAMQFLKRTSVPK
jgi:tetratricopeptide (TPR) repeat protein